MVSIPGTRECRCQEIDHEPTFAVRAVTLGSSGPLSSGPLSHGVFPLRTKADREH